MSSIIRQPLPILFAALLAGSALPVPAATADGVAVAAREASLVLDGAWRFHPGDDPAWADPAFDDGAWETIRVPIAWGRQGHRDADAGWYRLTLRLGDAARAGEPQLGITMRSVASGYQLYAGGERIGALGGPPPELAYDRHRTFAIPERAVAADGTLVLAVRVWRHPAEGPRSGGLREAPIFGPLATLTRDALAAQLPALILAVLFVAVGLYHLQLFRRRPRERAYLWYALLVLMQAAYTLLGSQLRFVISDNFVLLKEWQYLATYLLPALSIQLLFTYFAAPIGRALRAYQLSFPVIGIVLAVTPGLELNLAALPFFALWSLPGFAANLTLIARRAWHGDPDGRTLGFGTLLLALAYGYEILAANNLAPQAQLSAYGLAAFVLSMAIALADRFNRVHNQLDALRGDLEARVAQRTRDLAAATRAAEDASRAKSEFLANVSHEIRTPLNGIVGIVDLLRRLALPAKAEEYAGLLAASADGLQRIIDDILDFSKIEVGKLALEMVDFELVDTVRGVEQLLAPRAAAKGLVLRSTFDPALPARVNSDPVRLRQVLLNLVDNAIKFTDRGNVAVAVSFDPDGGGGGRLRVSVRDTGVGIAPEALGGLFSPFTQVDSSAARRFGGTGLGLAICKELVQLVGGEIGVESDAIGGSTFSFTWPVAAAGTHVRAAAAVPAASAQATTHRILVAEDNPVSQLIVLEQLEALGHRADAVADGHQALAALAGKRYDLVLMDCQMPGLDGYQATRRLRQREAGGRHTPVIALTAHAMAGDREKCLAAGMDGHLPKPYTQEALAAVLARWLTAADAGATRAETDGVPRPAEP